LILLELELRSLDNPARNQSQYRLRYRGRVMDLGPGILNFAMRRVTIFCTSYYTHCSVQCRCLGAASNSGRSLSCVPARSATSATSANSNSTQQLYCNSNSTQQLYCSSCQTTERIEITALQIYSIVAFVCVTVTTWLLLNHCSATAVVCRAISYQLLLHSCLHRDRHLATALHAHNMLHAERMLLRFALIALQPISLS
jgi:hypothetical protein